MSVVGAPEKITELTSSATSTAHMLAVTVMATAGISGYFSLLLMTQIRAVAQMYAITYIVVTTTVPLMVLSNASTKNAAATKTRIAVLNKLTMCVCIASLP